MPYGAIQYSADLQVVDRDRSEERDRLVQALLPQRRRRALQHARAESHAERVGAARVEHLPVRSFQLVSASWLRLFRVCSWVVS